MASRSHPIYGDLVYQRADDVAGTWYLVDGDVPLDTVEWYVDDGATPQEVIGRMSPWQSRKLTVETVERIAAARQAFWDRQR